MYVTGGGCSGFQYGFSFDETVNEDDTVVEKRVRLLVDSLSYPYLVGSEVDYKESLQGAQFVIKTQTQVRPAAVAVPFQWRSPVAPLLLRLSILILACVVPVTYAALRYLRPPLWMNPLDILPEFGCTPLRITRLLVRAEELHQSHPDTFIPVAFVLHGPEVKFFYKRKLRAIQ